MGDINLPDHSGHETGVGDTNLLDHNGHEFGVEDTNERYEVSTWLSVSGTLANFNRLNSSRMIPAFTNLA